MRYKCFGEAKRREIVGAIEATGVVKDAESEFDIDAIADEVFTFVDGWDEARGVFWVDEQGWELDESVDFWATVEKHSFE